MQEKLAAFQRLLTIMDELREKCPWDKKQTMQSLRHLTIEETYELTDAILANNLDEVKKELGDLMLHIVFYAKIGSETNRFNMADVLNGICDKLIHRHPHIYGETQVEDEEEVKKNWEKLKLKEGKTSVLEGVPKSLPALVKAVRIQEKARGIGFDWDNREQVWSKMKEEMEEFHVEMEAINDTVSDDKTKVEAEFGDVLFSLINYARFIGVNPEDALEKTNKKFVKRFQFMEAEVNKKGKQLSEMTLKEMDVFWEEAKRMEG